MSSELKGIRLWQKHFPAHVPRLLWKVKRTQHLMILQEWVTGRDLLDLTVNDEKQDSAFQQSQALRSLFQMLTVIWGETLKRKKHAEVDF